MYFLDDDIWPEVESGEESDVGGDDARSNGDEGSIELYDTTLPSQHVVSVLYMI